MKQSINEAAREELIHNYANVYNGNGVFKYGQEAMINMFLKGAEWQSKQSPYISVNDKLPETDDNVVYINNLSGAVGIGFYVDNMWHVSYTGEEVHGVTHWMYIPNFP